MADTAPAVAAAAAEPVVAAAAVEAVAAVEAAPVAADVPPSALEKKIAKQLAFYFSDSNMPKDAFLQGEAAKDADSWVPLTVLATFNKLKAMTTEAAVMAAAVRKAEGDRIEISEDGTKIRRNPKYELPDVKVLNARTIYAKGFPVQGSTIETVQEFFEAAGFKVLSVRLRRTLQAKEFKGSAFVELADPAEAERCVALPLKLEDVDLIIEMKSAYHKRKSAERNEAKKARQGDGEGAAAMEIVYEKGLIVRFSGVPEGCTREDLKEAFGKFAECKWVDFSRDDPKGNARFATAEDATKVVEGMREATVKDAVLEMAVVDGDDEKKYWQQVDEDKKKRMRKGGRKFRGSSKRKRDGRGRGANKRAKLD